VAADPVDDVIALDHPINAEVQRITGSTSAAEIETTRAALENIVNAWVALLPS
jgi:hypothetical protein